MSVKTEICWICGEDARTREHRTKASDLRALFGSPTQNSPLYFHTDARRNRRIGSINSDTLKFTNRICEACNTARTQSHDYAWEKCAAYFLQHHRVLTAGQFVRMNSFFPYDTKREMLNVHLYFVKLFGCQIKEGNIAIELQPFSKSILDGKAHPNVYLGFGIMPSLPVTVAGHSNVEALLLDGKVAYATWLYQLGKFCVEVIYAQDGEKRQGLVDAWNPRLGTKRLKIRPIG